MPSKKLLEVYIDLGAFLRILGAFLTKFSHYWGGDLRPDNPPSDTKTGNCELTWYKILIYGVSKIELTKVLLNFTFNLYFL